MPPKYYNSKFKVKAREKNVSIYRSLTGFTSIPENGQYLTLANWQPPDCEGTEIVQMRKSRLLISDSQFYGVDDNEEIIIQNRKWHPKANWLHGYWEDAIMGIDNFNPSLIYLDMTSFVSTPSALHTINTTMRRCHKGTVLLVNLMLNDPRSSRFFDGSSVVRNLSRMVPSIEISKWKQEIHNFTYNATGHTEMKTFVFFKEKE